MGYICPYSTTTLLAMTQKTTRRVATALLCTLSLFISAQQPGTLKQKEQDVELKKAIHFLDEGPSSLSTNDLEIIAGYNFETYRKNDSRIKVQLVKGPILELLSKKEMTGYWASGKIIAPNSNHPLEVTGTNTTEELILQLNIGLGYAKKQHTEVTH